MEPAPLHRIPLDEPCLLHCGQHSSSQSVSLSLTTFGHRYKPISLYHLASISARFNCTAGNNNNMDTGLRQWPLFFALVDTTTGLLPGPLSADPYHPSSSPIILLLLWVVLLFVLCSMHCRRTPLVWWWSSDGQKDDYEDSDHKCCQTNINSVPKEEEQDEEVVMGFVI